MDPRGGAPFLTGLATAVRTAWGGQFEFHVNRPQWQWIGARVVVDIQVRKQEAAGRAADDHFSIKSVKTPPEGAGPNELHGREGVNSQVAGDNDRTNAFDQNMTLSSQDILPSKRPLLATVPVFFEHDKSDIKPAERTKIRKFASKWQGAAPGTAGSRPASVELKAMTTASGSDVYNQGLAQRRADAVKAELAAAGFNSVNTRVAETPLGETPAAGSEDANFRRVDMIPDGGGAQTVAVHEFGHAFGLDDEYGAEFGAGRPAAGTAVGHDAATKKMTDATGANLPGAVVENNNNIMSVGGAVQPQHYSTFHEALRAISGIEEWALGPKQARPGGPGGAPAPAPGRVLREGREVTGRAWPLAVLALVLAACGDAAQEPRVTELDALPLLELRIDSARGGGSELRVRPDGRFELRTDEHGWSLVSEYSPADLEELRREMARTDDPPLPDVIPAPGRGGSNPTRMTWRLRLADELREVVVEEWNDGVSPPLERLYEKLFTIAGGPAVESTWRVRVNGEVVERRVVGEAAGVRMLAPMIAALYRRPDAFEPVGPGEPPGDLLVDVRHTVDGAAGRSPGDRARRPRVPHRGRQDQRDSAAGRRTAGDAPRSDRADRLAGTAGPARRRSLSGARQVVELRVHRAPLFGAAQEPELLAEVLDQEPVPSSRR